MSISLVKGQKVDLTKGNAGLTKLLIGLGWDVAGSGGLFSRSTAIDLDASALLLDANGRVVDIVYFGNKQSNCGGIFHTGDNLTGAGDGDDEQLIVELSRVAMGVQRIVFVVNIYDCARRKQDFGQVRNAYIRAANGNTGSEMIRYNLSENYAGKTTLLTGEIYRHNGEWKFSALGEGTNHTTLSEIKNHYN